MILSDLEFDSFKSEILAFYDQIKSNSRNLSRESRDLAADASRIQNDDATVQSLEARKLSKEEARSIKARDRFQAAVGAINNLEVAFDGAFKSLEDKIFEVKNTYTLTNAQSSFLSTIEGFAADVKSAFDVAETSFEDAYKSSVVANFVSETEKFDADINEAFEIFYNKKSKAENAKASAEVTKNDAIVEFAAIEGAHLAFVAMKDAEIAELKGSTDEASIKMILAAEEAKEAALIEFADTESRHGALVAKLDADITYWMTEIDGFGARVESLIRSAAEAIDKGIADASKGGQFLQFEGKDVTSFDFIYEFGEGNFGSADLVAARESINTAKQELHSVELQAQNELSNFTTNVNRFVGDVSGSQAEITKLTDDIALLESEIVALEESKAKEADAEIKVTSSLENEKAGREMAKAELKGLVSQLELEVSGTTGYTAVQEQITEKQDFIGKIENTIMELSANLATIEATIAQANSDIAAKNAEKVDKGAQKVGAEETFAAASNELDSVIAQRKEVSAALEAEVEAKTNAVKDLEVGLTALDPFRAAIPSIGSLLNPS